MSVVKDEGSSHRKGKEIAVDNPLTKTMGEEAPLFELNHSKEKEGGRNLNSECPPFINPWYDTYAYFPIVPDDYLPSPLGHVFLHS